jgi:acyl dehydratase
MNYFEDFHIGQRILFGCYTVTQTEIIEFAKQYDPQSFHVDESHRLTAELGGIMASGWHTAAIFMRLAVDAYLGNAAVLTSPGVDELRWLAPVRAGDIISGEATVEEARLSVSKPDRGILTTGVRLWNQSDIDVLTMRTRAFFRVRPPH